MGIRMKPIVIFLWLMIYLDQAAEGHFLQDEGIPEVHHGQEETLEATELEMNRHSQNTNYSGIPWPYVGEKCCNLTTTPKCWRKGGQCMPMNDTCMGNVHNGPRYCDFNKLKSCKCCVPADCKTLSPCAAMNGTCSVTCEGKSVSGKDFCKDHKFCKCCLPDLPDDCPCGQDYGGGCNGQLPSGNWTDGHCMKSCDIGTTPLRNHLCSKTGGEECNCCTPFSFSCPDGCFKAGSGCFKAFWNFTNWYDAWGLCHDNGLSFSMIKDFQAVSYYSGFEGYFWIGAYTEPNTNKVVEWTNGVVVGPDAPWVRPIEQRQCGMGTCVKFGTSNPTNCYEEDNWCIWCEDCSNHKANPLCGCEPIYSYP